jgi:hypothetical protein
VGIVVKSKPQIVFAQRSSLFAELLNSDNGVAVPFFVTAPFLFDLLFASYLISKCLSHCSRLIVMSSLRCQLTNYLMALSNNSQ